MKRGAVGIKKVVDKSEKYGIIKSSNERSKTMQELFNLIYLYDYMILHTIEEERKMYIILRNTTLGLIEDMGAE